MLTKEQLLEEYENNVLLGPLNGIVILGFCYYVAGPIALQNLVNQGALVIKIEKTPIGDPSRHVFSSAYYNSISHGQISIAIDYDDEEDRQLLSALISIADAIIDNRSIRAKQNDKILQRHFCNPNKEHPKIYCSINGYPNEKLNTDPGLDASVQAATGLAYTNCASEENPLKTGVPILDQVTGLLAANHVISNLYYLQTSPFLPESAKEMIYISVSMAGVSMWLQAGQVIQVLEEGSEIFRKGNQDQFAVPFSYYTAKNGLLSVATVNEEQFKRFCLSVLEDGDFYSIYPTFELRLKNQDEFEKELNKRLLNNDREYWCQRCKEIGIPASPVLTISEAIQQEFFKDILHRSTDGQPIITQGTSHSMFIKRHPEPAPKFNQQHASLTNLYLRSRIDSISVSVDQDPLLKSKSRNHRLIEHSEEQL
jgi:CoA:oxalate CoA-transferase